MTSDPNLRFTSVGKNNNKRSIHSKQLSPKYDDYIAKIDMLIKQVEQALEI